MSKHSKNKKERLQKFLAGAGVASRRKAEEMILAGRVRVNSRKVTELGTKVDPHRDRVELDGKLVRSERFVYWFMNKPRGLVSTVSDPEGRPTVLEILPDVRERVFPVGRLDIATEGALLLTNDGELTNALLHPSKMVKKVYRARLRGQVSDEAVDMLRKGVPLDDRVTAAARVRVTARTSSATWVELTIHEGGKRQVRRMAEAVGHPVLRLIRVSFAGLSVADMKPGTVRELSKKETAALKKQFLQ